MSQGPTSLNASKATTNDHHMGRMAKPLFRRFEFQEVVDRRPWMAAEEPIRRVWSSNEFVCVTSGVLLKQLEGLKKEAIQKADSAEV